VPSQLAAAAVLGAAKAGGTNATAELGVLQPGQNLVLNGSLKRNATQNYEFQVNAQMVVSATLSGLTGKAELILANAQMSPLGVYAHGKANDSFTFTFSPGVYYARVLSLGSAKTKYQIDVNAQASNTAPTMTPPTSTSPRATPTGSTPTPTPTPAPVTIPTVSTAYNIAITGTTYYGNTDILYSNTMFTPYTTFSRTGELVVTPTVDTTNVSGNGVNPRDVIINTGNIGLGGAGVMEYASNIFLHTLFGGNFTQDAAVDVANVSANLNQGTLQVQPDPNTARISQLNVMYVNNGLLSTPYEVVAGEMDLQFSNQGTQVSGKISFFGSGIIDVGTVAITASFQGTVAS
jgi:hypothetical protein